MGNCVSASKGQDSALKLDLSVGPVPDDRPSILIQSPIKGSVIGVRSLAAELGMNDIFWNFQEFPVNRFRSSFDFLDRNGDECPCSSENS